MSQARPGSNPVSEIMIMPTALPTIGVDSLKTQFHLQESVSSKYKE